MTLPLPLPRWLRPLLVVASVVAVVVEGGLIAAAASVAGGRLNQWMWRTVEKLHRAGTGIIELLVIRTNEAIIQSSIPKLIISNKI